MDLLTKGQDNDLQKKIIMTLKEVGLTDEELSAAQEFFDFSKDIDLSLLDKLHYRRINYDTSHKNSSMLYADLLRLPNKKSIDATNRFILFLDAIGGNKIGRLFMFGVYSYMYNDAELARAKKAFELRYPPEDVPGKIAALVAYGINSEKVLYNDTLIRIIKDNRRCMYRAGKYFCFGEDGFAKARLYSLALAYCEDEEFTREEIDEMQSYILARNKELNAQYTAVLENVVIMLFMSMKNSAEIKAMLRQRLSHDYTKLFPAFLQFVPQDYFESNMEVLAEIADGSDDMTGENLIKLAVRSAAASNAFIYRKNSTYSENSMNFLEMVARKYTEEYITVMTANEAVGTGARWGYFFDYFSELSEILEKEVPGAKEKYAVRSQNELVELTIHREVLDVKNSIRKQVMDYLRGDADISVLLEVRATLAENHKQWNGSMEHEGKMLGQLVFCEDFYGRYVALKMIQNISCIKFYLLGLDQYAKDMGIAVKQIFSAAIRAGVPIEDRIRTYEVLYSYMSYWENKKKTLNDAIIAVMSENSEKCDSDYEKECMKHQTFTCCCYAEYLGKTNTDNKNKDRLLALCGHSSKEVRRTVINILAACPDYENDIIALLSAKKQALRETAVDIISLWGVGKYREVLEKAADTEKSVKLADKIRALLSSSVSASLDEKGNVVFSPAAFVEDIHKGGRARKLSWVYEAPMPGVSYKNGGTAEEKYMQALLLCYCTMPVPGRNNNAFLLASELDENELNRFAAEVFSRWYSAGAEAKTKWAMYFAIIHGGDSMVEYALKCIREWAENMRGAIAAEAVRAIALNGSSQALMAVDNLAHKFKQKQVKKAAAEAMESAAQELGITADELGDRIVPDLGFDDCMERIFDYGSRKFRVCLSMTLELEVFDENNKKLKTIPSPGKKDDEAVAKESNAQFKALKKQLKNVISIQKLRLETALMADRRWTKENWEALFVRNPVMRCFAESLIWAAYSNEECTTFRYMEDGTFNTVDEDEFELPEGSVIGLVHPIELDDETLNAWKEQLSDYEVTQQIPQLERPIYRIKDDEIGKLDLNRFNGRSINALSLMGRMIKYGWSKGSAQDAGMFYVFYREDVTGRINNPDGSVSFTGSAAELHFSGAYIAVEDDQVLIENVRFYEPGTIEHGSYVYDEADDEKAITLDRIPPRYFSEIVMQLEEITKSTEG